MSQESHTEQPEMSTDSVSSISKLPMEIWKACWSYSSRCDLRHLTSVCRYFRNICQRDLFRNVSYGGLDLFDLIRESSDPILPLQRLVNRFETFRTDPASLQIRAMVQECRFMGLDDSKNLLCDQVFQLAYENLSTVLATLKLATKAFINLVSTCSNVRVVGLTWTDMDDELWGMLEVLPNLEQLILHECRMIGTTNRQVALKTLHVSSVRRKYKFPPSIHINIVSPARLTTLTLDDEYCNDAILSSIITLGTFPYLKHLAILIEESTLDSFFTLLRATPQLSSLQITGCPRRILSSSLTPDVVPLLASYDGPLHAATLFTNRPLSDVKIRPSVREGPSSHPSFWADQRASLASLAKSTTGVKCLSLYSVIPTPDLDPFNTVAAYLPHLRALNASFARYPAISQNIAHLILSGRLVLPPQLEILRLRWRFPSETPLDDANERVLVEKLYEAYSCLKEIRLGTSELFWLRTGRSWASVDARFVQAGSEW